MKLSVKTTDFFYIPLTSFVFCKNYVVFYREKLRTFLQGKTTYFFTGKNYGLFYREKLRTFLQGKTTDFFTLKTPKLSLEEFIALSTVEKKGAENTTRKKELKIQTCQGNTTTMPYWTTRPPHQKNSTWCSGKYMFSLTITSDTCQHSKCGSRFRMCLNP